MLLAHRPTKILVTGASGSGKSTFFTRYVSHAPHAYKFIFDHEGETCYRLGLTPALEPDELLAAVPGRWIVFDPVEMFPGDTQAGFNFFCEWTFAVSVELPGKKLFACDELQMLVGTNGCPWEFALLYETGRRYGLDCVLISQQPNLIHNRIRNALSEVVTFAQMDGNAMDFLTSFGFQEETVRQLVAGEFICRQRTGAETRGRIF